MVSTYDLGARVRTLLMTVFDAKTFEAINTWDAEALEAVNDIEAHLTRLESMKASSTMSLALAQSEHQEKSFFKRIISSRGKINQAQTELEQFERDADVMCFSASKLQDYMGMTPNDPAQRKLLVRGLKLKIKELRLRKREILADIRGTNQESMEMVSATTTSLWNLTQTGRQFQRWERIDIRAARVQANAPRVAAREQIDGQIHEFDKLVLWAEILQ